MRFERVGVALVAFADAAGRVSPTCGMPAPRSPGSAPLDEVRRSRFDAGRALIRELIEEVAPGDDPSIAVRCERCGADDHGPVRAVHAPVALSVSYAGSVVAVSAAHNSDACAVGIDIEAGRPGETLTDLAAIFAPSPPPTRRDWTAIEAALKADGRGLNVSPETVRLGEGRATLPDSTRSIALFPVPVPPGLTATLAVIPR